MIFKPLDVGDRAAKLLAKQFMLNSQTPRQHIPDTPYEKYLKKLQDDCLTKMYKLMTTNKEPPTNDSQ